MANWNDQSAYWNRDIDSGGFIWNTDKLFKIKYVGETIAITDKDTEVADAIKMTARIALREKPLSLTDDGELYAFFKGPGLDDKFIMEETDATVSLLFFIAEELGIKDEMTDFVALLAVQEDITLLDELKLFVELLSNETIKMDDIGDLYALYEKMEEFGLVDLKLALQAFYDMYEKFGLTDHEPRTAVSDFMIGAIDTDDRAYDWLIPFGLKIDWGNTNVEVMPEAELTTVEIPGMDGSIVEDTTYKDRIFNIVAYSEMGFTTYQKEQLKKKINRVLDSTKHQTKKLTIQASSTSFDVKYSGQAQIEEGPSYVKATIPFHTGPYGYDMFPYELHGSGLIWNDGDTFLRPVHRIKGPVSNPSFKLGEITYRWSGYVPSGSVLVINHDSMTCYLEDAFGKRKNAMTGFTGKFQAIPVDGSEVLVADSNTENKITTLWRNNLLY